MLAEELLELVNTTIRQKAESQTVEVKAAHVDCPKRLYDTLSSFSNQDSGISRWWAFMTFRTCRRR